MSGLILKYKSMCSLLLSLALGCWDSHARRETVENF